MSEIDRLTQSVDHPAPKRGELPRWRILAGLLLAPLAFSLQIVASYVVAALGCDAGRQPHLILYAIVIGAVVTMIAGLLIALANFRATRDEAGGSHQATQDKGDGRTRFLAYFGLCASAVFALAALVQLSSIITLAACVGFSSTS